MEGHWKFLGGGEGMYELKLNWNFLGWGGGGSERVKVPMK